MAVPSLLALVDALWSAPDEEVYAVLDAARDPAVLARLTASELRAACLYEGRVAREIAEVAPYLVALRRDRKATAQLLEGAWGRSWGIFARSPVDFEIMRRHFRRFLRVADESGKTMLFRYYDPRVLRVYLPTCTPREHDSWFGPLAPTAYFAEDEDALHLNVYTRADGAFAATRVALAE